jgi:hypothetical protein
MSQRGPGGSGERRGSKERKSGLDPATMRTPSWGGMCLLIPDAGVLGVNADAESMGNVKT